MSIKNIQKIVFFNIALSLATNLWAEDTKINGATIAELPSNPHVENAPRLENKDNKNLPDIAVKVLEFVLTTKIEGREPQDNVSSYHQENEKAYAFARLSATKPSQVTFLWLRDGKEQTRFNTNVHASQKWRTFSAVKLRPGQWKVQLLSENNVLDEKTFTVQ